MIKGILIDAYKQEVREVEYDGLQDIYALTACGCVDVIHLRNDDAVYVDDEGLINGTEVAFSIEGRVLMGNGLVCSTDDEGDDAPPKSTLAEINAKVIFGSKKSLLIEGNLYP